MKTLQCRNIKWVDIEAKVLLKHYRVDLGGLIHLFVLLTIHKGMVCSDLRSQS